LSQAHEFDFSLDEDFGHSLSPGLVHFITKKFPNKYLENFKNLEYYQLIILKLFAVFYCEQAEGL
jgi:hypothetical protein